MIKKVLVMSLVLGMVSGAMAASITEIKGDVSCPGDASTKAGGDWTDFEWGGGCDGEQHDGRTWTVDGVGFGMGNPGGHCNIQKTGGDALTNTEYWDNSDNGLFKIWNLDAGDYEVVVVGDAGASGTYNFTSTGTGDIWMVFSGGDKGVDNFILTSLGAVVTGACCLADGSCVEDTEAACAAAGGTYQGDDVLCIDVTCPIITGACCLPDGSCVEETEGDCAAGGGTYQGDDVLCIDVTCPQPEVIGACCLGNENCVDDLTEAECVVAPYNGRFMGADSECASVDCSAGECPCNGDLSGDGWLSPTDVSALVSMLLPEVSNYYWKLCE